MSDPETAQRPACHSVHARRGGRGYTAIEVLLAMTVLIISTAGVMSMQKAAIQGNLDARKLDVANSVARTWLDRLATDAATWNSTAGMSNTVLLNTLEAQNGTFVSTALTTNSAAYPWTPAFDIWGRNVATTDATAIFCTRIKVDNRAFDANTALPSLLSATVLVFWSTQLTGGPAPAAPFCPQDVNVSASANGTYHMIFVTESLRRAS